MSTSDTNSTSSINNTNVRNQKLYLEIKSPNYLTIGILIISN